jgi:hypothetical protein
MYGFVAVAAYQRRLLILQEEEEMIKYNAEDLEGWEFKIIRSAIMAFRKPEIFDKVLKEEALSGWVFLEKLDDSRIRLRRRIENRSHNQNAGIDPYRSYYGYGGNELAIIFAIVLLIVFFTLIAMFLAANS